MVTAFARDINEADSMSIRRRGHRVMKVTVCCLTLLALTLGACKSGPFTLWGFQEPVIVYTESGGFAPSLNEWRFYRNGPVEVLADGQVRRSFVPPYAIRQTIESILHAGFLDLEDAYRPDPVWTDAFAYRLSVTQGTRAKTVVAESGAALPPGLLASLQATYALIRQIPTAP